MKSIMLNRLANVCRLLSTFFKAAEHRCNGIRPASSEAVDRIVAYYSKRGCQQGSLSCQCPESRILRISRQEFSDSFERTKHSFYL